MSALVYQLAQAFEKALSLFFPKRKYEKWHLEIIHIAMPNRWFVPEGKIYEVYLAANALATVYYITKEREEMMGAGHGFNEILMQYSSNAVEKMWQPSVGGINTIPTYANVDPATGDITQGGAFTAPEASTLPQGWIMSEGEGFEFNFWDANELVFVRWRERKDLGSQ